MIFEYNKFICKNVRIWMPYFYNKLILFQKVLYNLKIFLKISNIKLIRNKSLLQN